jgi:hypothetical protein
MTWFKSRKMRETSRGLEDLLRVVASCEILPVRLEAFKALMDLKPWDNSGTATERVVRALIDLLQNDAAEEMRLGAAKGLAGISHFRWSPAALLKASLTDQSHRVRAAAEQSFVTLGVPCVQSPVVLGEALLSMYRMLLSAPSASIDDEKPQDRTSDLDLVFENGSSVALCGRGRLYDQPNDCWVKYDALDTFEQVNSELPRAGSVPKAVRYVNPIPGVESIVVPFSFVRRLMDGDRTSVVEMPYTIHGVVRISDPRAPAGERQATHQEVGVAQSCPDRGR